MDDNNHITYYDEENDGNASDETASVTEDMFPVSIRLEQKSNYDYDDEYDIYEDGFITGEEELRRYQEHMEQLDNNE
eukprot:gene13635-15060_t